MEEQKNNFNFQKQLISSKNMLFIQDIDGVCIPLVKDPMTRELESNYIYAVKELEEEFYVLTCGEHEGPRGVNRIIERSLRSTIEPKNKELYLRGLAACGVEYQDNNGEISFEGVTEKELDFLSKVPILIRPKFSPAYISPILSGPGSLVFLPGLFIELEVISNNSIPSFVRRLYIPPRCLSPLITIKLLL